MTPSTTSKTHGSIDVLVIGAGLSGLRAALEVQAAGLTCAVVEATDRVGGRTLSVPSAPGAQGVIDLGASWINDTSQAEMYRLLGLYGLHAERQISEGKSVSQTPDGIVVSGQRDVLSVGRLTPVCLNLGLY